MSFDAWQLKSGPVPVALGLEYRDEKYSEDHDEQANSGGFLGTSTRVDVGGARAVKALFGETSIPFGSAVTVNLAARIEGSIAQPGQILISDTTQAQVEQIFETRLVGEHRPKGISRGVACFEVLGRR